MAVRRKQEQEGINGLPEWVMNPPIPIDPTSDHANRRYQAYQAFVAYVNDLRDWVRPTFNVGVAGPVIAKIQRSCGTEMSDFFAVADKV